MKHINEAPPSVRDLRRDVPPRVADAVARALEKDPRDRFASMETFAAELDACLRELARPGTRSTATVITPPAPRAAARSRPRRRDSPTPLLIVALLALAALAVIGVAAFAVNRDDSDDRGDDRDKQRRRRRRSSRSAPSAATTPPGDDNEHDAEAPNATDGDPATYWTTEHYGSEDFGGSRTASASC